MFTPKTWGKTFNFDDFSDGLVEANQPVFGKMKIEISFVFFLKKNCCLVSRGLEVHGFKKATMASRTFVSFCFPRSMATKGCSLEIGKLTEGGTLRKTGVVISSVTYEKRPFVKGYCCNFTCNW